MLQCFFTLVTLLFCLAHAADTLPERHAEQLGLTHCAEGIRILSNSLIGDDSHGVDTVWHQTNPDERLLSFFVVLEQGGYEQQVTMQFIPHEQACDAMFTITMVHEEACETLQKEGPAHLVFDGYLGNTLVMSNEKAQTSTYLTPQGVNGNLCLMTIRGVLY